MEYLSKKRQILAINILGFVVNYIVYKNSALNGEQILIYIGLQIIAINLLFFQYKITKIISIILIMGIGFLCVLGFLPLFNNAPENSKFYITQQTEYLFIGNPNNNEIIDETEDGKQNINLKQTEQQLLLSENQQRKITINQKNNKEISRFIIKFPNNTIYIAYPGTKIEIEKSNNKYTITKEYGKIEYYKPNENTEVIIKNTTPQEQKQKSDFSLGYMIENYEKLNKQYTINQGGGLIIMQPLYQKFSKKLLEIAYIIRPKIYQKNLENYEKYRQILERKTESNTYKMNKSWRSIVSKQIGKGLDQTSIIK